MVSVSSLFLFYYFKHTYFIVFQNVCLSEALGMPFILFVVSENLLMVNFVWSAIFTGDFLPSGNPVLPEL